MKKLMGTIILLFAINIVFSQNQSELFKALYLYNFTKNIEWPANFNKGDITIGVFGNSVVLYQLKKIAEYKSSKNHAITIKKYKTPDEIKDCNLLFIPKSKTTELPAISKALKNKKTVIVCEKKNALRSGAMINLITINQKLVFEINEKGFKEKNILMSENLKILRHK